MKNKNVVFVLVDQWPSDCFGHKGDKNINTPNMDQLVSEGTVFNNAFTSCPLCSPARGALLSSKWHTQTGLLDNVGVGYSKQEPLSLNVETWLEGAVSKGYHVGYYGKWHLGEDGPKLRGIQGHDKSVESFLQPYDKDKSNYSYLNSKKGYVEQASILIDGNQPFYGTTNEKVENSRPYTIVKEGIKFLDEYVETKNEKPFMLTVSINDPHFPHYLPKDFVEEVEDFQIELPKSIDDDFLNKPWFQYKAWWPSMDTSKLTHSEWKKVIKFAYMHRMLVDRALGNLFNKIKEYKLDEDTVIIFTSDHGDMCGAHNRFDKGAYFYDEVWRIPLIIKDSSKTPAIQNSFVSILDIGRTLMSYTGYTPNERVEGKDISILVGENDTPNYWTQEAYGMYNAYNGMSFEVRAIRDERYKYVYNPQAIDEFYDLEKDPYELINLNNQLVMTPKQKELKEKLNLWMKNIDDPILKKKLTEAGIVNHLGIVGP